MKMNKTTLIKEWCIDCKRLRLSPTGVYKTERLRRHFQIMMVMLCKLHWLKDATGFWQEWEPLVSDMVYKGTIFNSGAILSTNLKSSLAVEKYKDPQLKENFFMSSYLMDACCAHNHFQRMKCTFNPREAPIHVFCSLLWESKYRSNYEKICNDLLLPLHCLLIDRKTYCMTENTRVALSEIGDWFMSENFT